MVSYNKMPAAIPIIALAISAVGTGVGVYKSLNPPSPGGPSPAEMTQDAIKNETQNRKQAAIQASQLVPGLVDNTSGSLSPNAYNDLAANFSGNAQYADSPLFKQMLNNFFGTGASSYGGSDPYGSFTSPGLTFAPPTGAGGGQ